jgi:penicillin amidase
MDRSTSVDEFREALRPWHVPLFSLVIADVDGHIAYQSAGRIPIRKSLERGYRPGYSPEHQWQGLIPFEAMPHVIDPPRGWIASANNRLAPDDYPYLLFGCWASGRRAMRIRQMIEARQRLSVEDMRDMHLDTMSLRAVELVPCVIATVPFRDDQQTAQAISYLKNWDYRVQTDSVAAAIFNVFFTLWCRTVAAERFDAEFVDLLANGVPGTASRLLQGDSVNWFAKGDRLEQIEKTFLQALDLLSNRFGPDMTRWCWGQLHRMPLKHVLSSRGELGALLDHGGKPVHGDMTTCGRRVGITKSIWNGKQRRS